MNRIIKILLVSMCLFLFSMVSSTAYIMDVWTIEGMDSQALSEATAAYKEKAMAGGAKMKNIRSSTKVRGDNSQETTFVHVYYESYSELMHDLSLTAANPDWFDSTYGRINMGATSNNAIMSNSSPLPGVGSNGQTVAYTFVEVINGIDIRENMPKFREKMQSAGARIDVDMLTCVTCGATISPANAMIYFAAANPADMGKAMDIFSSNEMQIWVATNIAAHVDAEDNGMLVFNN